MGHVGLRMKRAGASRLSASVRRVNDLPIQARRRSVIDGVVTLEQCYVGYACLVYLCFVRFVL